ncbi:MAG: hypothetical protein PEPC_01931 [Peptostreptococcus russellii]
MNIHKVKKLLIDRKVVPLANSVSIVTWCNELYPKLENQLKELGFVYGCINNHGISVSEDFILLGNANQWHIGYNKNGELRFVDAKIYKIRKRFIFRNIYQIFKRYLKCNRVFRFFDTFF